MGLSLLPLKRQTPLGPRPTRRVPRLQPSSKIGFHLERRRDPSEGPETRSTGRRELPGVGRTVLCRWSETIWGLRTDVPGGVVVETQITNSSQGSSDRSQWKDSTRGFSVDCVAEHPNTGTQSIDDISRHESQHPTRLLLFGGPTVTRQDHLQEWN